MKRPRFAIILPTHNRATFVAGAIRSLRLQSFINWCAIVVDDGGGDETADVVATCGDERISYHWKKNEERSIARNIGVDLTDSDYVIFLDSDDRLLHEALEQVDRFAQDHDDPPLIAAGYRLINAESGDTRDVWLPSIPVLDSLQQDNLIALGSVAFRRDVLENLRFVASPDANFAEDWCLLLRMASRYDVLAAECLMSVVTEHSGRSLRDIDPERYSLAVSLTCEAWRTDQSVRDRLGPKRLNKLIARQYLTIAQHYLIGRRKHRSLALPWLARVIQLDAAALVSRVGFACAKKLLLP